MKSPLGVRRQQQEIKVTRTQIQVVAWVAHVECRVRKQSNSHCRFPIATGFSDIPCPESFLVTRRHQITKTIPGLSVCCEGRPGILSKFDFGPFIALDHNNPAPSVEYWQWNICCRLYLFQLFLFWFWINTMSTCSTSISTFTPWDRLDNLVIWSQSAGRYLLCHCFLFGFFENMKILTCWWHLSDL